MIAASCSNGINQSPLAMVSTLWMYFSVCHIDGRTDRLSSVKLPALKTFYPRVTPVLDSGCVHHAEPKYDNRLPQVLSRESELRCVVPRWCNCGYYTSFIAASRLKVTMLGVVWSPASHSHGRSRDHHLHVVFTRYVPLISDLYTYILKIIYTISL